MMLLCSLRKRLMPRLGVFALDTGTSQTITYNADNRFAYASTHKVLTIGALLQKISIADLNQIITYTQNNIVNYNPITEKHVNTGMPLRELCDAALRYSDNTAERISYLNNWAVLVD